MFLTEITFIQAILAAGLRMATPVLLAALGEAVSEKGGILNIGVEGTMLVGAWAGFTAAYAYEDPWIGILVGSLSGCVVGLIHAFLTITRKSDQSVTGIVINLLCVGVTSVLFWKMFSDKRVIIQGLSPIEIPVLSKIPFLGPIFFSQIPLVYLALILVPVVFVLINRTRLGLRLRAVGEHPLAAETSGIKVQLTRYTAVLVGAALMGLAGATLSVGVLGGFRDNMTAGRGYIALAIVVLGKWNPYGVLGGALIFGIADALQLRLQAMGVGVPHQLLLMIPYILTILVLIGFAGGANSPSWLARPYPEKDAK